MFSFEAIISLVGRFFIAGTRDLTTTVFTVVAVGVEEVVMRSQRVRLTQLMRRFKGLPPLTGEKLQRLIDIAAEDERQDSTIEANNIIVATVLTILFWEYHRYIIDLNFQVEREMVSVTLGVGVLQLAVELLLIDPLCIWLHLKDGWTLPNPWYRKGRRKLHITREVVQCIMGMLLTLIAYRLVPIYGNCKSADVCECDFTKTLATLQEHCCKISGR